MSKSNEVTRRSLLAGTSAAVALAVLPNAAKAVEAGSSLEQIIADHRAAYASHCDALAAWDDVRDAYETRPKPRAPMSVRADGSCMSGFYELGIISPEEIRRRIGEFHDSLRRVHCSNWTQDVFPSFTEAMGAEIDACERRALVSLNQIIAEEQVARVAAGVEAADVEVDRTGAIERQALVAFLAYRPGSEAERTLKVEYIASHEHFTGVTSLDDEETAELLITALCEVL